MSNNESSGAAPPDAPPDKPGFWQRVKGLIVRTETEFAVFKGVALLGFLGTLIGAYFQYLSAYEDKVTTQAKDDLAAATQTFTEASTALSVPLSLQERLIFGYYDAVAQNIDADDNAYVTKSTRAFGRPYEDAYTALRQSINLLAQKVVIYVDWASDTSRDPAVSIPPTADPISISALGTFNFDCDNELPAFDSGKSVLELKNNAGKALDVDWYSAKHNVLTIYYCFYVTHQLMKAARQWASAAPVDADEKSKFIKQKDLILNRLSNQVFRLNAFMGLVLNEIEEVRVRYRPNGFWCSVPGVREAIGRKCAPLRTAGQ